MGEHTFKIQDQYGLTLEVTEKEVSFFDELRKEYFTRKEFSAFGGEIKAPSLSALKRILLIF